MKHIPNILSAIRIAMIPCIVAQLLQGATLQAGVLLIVSGATDLLDGWLARHFNWVSQLGKVLDPIADKMTQGALSATLIFVMRSYWPFFAILIAKDFVMLVLGGWLIKQGVTLKGARWFGKLATIVYYLAVTTIVLFGTLANGIKIALLSVSAGCSILAALLYLPEYLHYKAQLAQRNQTPSDAP